MVQWTTHFSSSLIFGKDLQNKRLIYVQSNICQGSNIPSPANYCGFRIALVSLQFTPAFGYYHFN